MVFQHSSLSKNLSVFFSYVTSSRNIIYDLKEICLCERLCKFPLIEFSVLSFKIGDYTFGLQIHYKDLVHLYLLISVQ